MLCQNVIDALAQPRGSSTEACRPLAQLHHEVDRVADQATQGQDLDGEEVGRRNRIPMGAEKCSPWRPLASFRRGLDAVLQQDALDGVAPDLMAEVAQGIVDSSVPPARALLGHPDDKFGDGVE